MDLAAQQVYGLSPANSGSSSEGTPMLLLAILGLVVLSLLFLAVGSQPVRNVAVALFTTVALLLAPIVAFVAPAASAPVAADQWTGHHN